MIRALNLACALLMGLAILGLYHVSEKTRVARMELNATEHRIAAEKGAIAVMQAEWSHAAAPERVQDLAMTQGMQDGASAQMSSFEQLPARGEDAPLNGARTRNASEVIPAPQAPAQPQPGLQD